MGKHSIVITTNEPREIKNLFGEQALESPMGFDMLLYTSKTPLPIERKKVPGDLLASVTDGRLAREISAMREVSQFFVVLLHGTIIYRKDDSVYMYGNKGRNWTKKGVRNLLRTLQFVEGAYIEYASTDEELVQVVNELQEYFDRQYHLSFRLRPSFQTNWIMPTRQEKVIYFFQGLPGISAIRAKSLSEKFPSPLNLYQASVDDITQISGLGNVLATRIYNFLREG